MSEGYYFFLVHQRTAGAFAEHVSRGIWRRGPTQRFATFGRFMDFDLLRYFAPFGSICTHIWTTSWRYAVLRTTSWRSARQPRYACGG